MCSDLRFPVEPGGFEPPTSCMPCTNGVSWECCCAQQHSQDTPFVHGMQEVGGSNPPGSTGNRRSEHIYAFCSQRDDPAAAATGAATRPAVTPGARSVTGPEMPLEGAPG